MKGLPFVLLFTAMTFCSWGAYGPTLHHGAMGLDRDSLRAFVGVGLAYFAIAVLIPVFVLNRQGETGKWTVGGAIFSFFAGTVGAIGALGIILALAYGGRPVYVMPLVFGFAPVVNTLMTALLSRTFDQIRPIFVGGIITTALGAAGVLYFKPAPPAAEAAPAEEQADNSPTKSPFDFQAVAFRPQESEAESQEDAPATESDKDSDEAAGSSTSERKNDNEESRSELPETDRSRSETDSSGAEAETPTADEGEQPNGGAASNAGQAAGTSLSGIILSIVIAAICWGSYGPFLHVGQGKMAGSRLRPFACVGLAYFFIAVAVPLMMIYARPEDLGTWHIGGMSWSFGAGVLGAIGALGVILAFNAGGKPYYVMPLIFGFAPVINTFISLTETDTWSLVSIWFYLSLAIVIAGAVTVLTNAPKPIPPKPKTAPQPAAN